MKKTGGGKRALIGQSFTLKTLSLQKLASPLQAGGHWDWDPVKKLLNVKIELFMDGILESYIWPSTISGNRRLHSQTHHFYRPSDRPFLWKKTCFECFFKYSSSSFYREYHFSPWGHWHYLDFKSYRILSEKMVSQNIETDSLSPSFLISYSWDRVICHWTLSLKNFISHIPERSLSSTERTFLFHPTVVLYPESKTQKESSQKEMYLAVKHPSDQADFHDSSCYVLEIPVKNSP